MQGIWTRAERTVGPRHERTVMVAWHATIRNHVVSIGEFQDVYTVLKDGEWILEDERTEINLSFYWLCVTAAKAQEAAWQATQDLVMLTLSPEEEQEREMFEAEDRLMGDSSC